MNEHARGEAGTEIVLYPKTVLVGDFRCALRPESLGMSQRARLGDNRATSASSNACAAHFHKRIDELELVQLRAGEQVCRKEHYLFGDSGSWPLIFMVSWLKRNMELNTLDK